MVDAPVFPLSPIPSQHPSARLRLFLCLMNWDDQGDYLWCHLYQSSIIINMLQG